MNYNLGEDLCISCGCIIPYERIIIIPTTRTCAKCSSTKRVMGHQVFPHKTGSEVEVMSPETWTNIQRLDRRRTNQHRRR